MRASFYVTFDREGFIAAYKTERFDLKRGQYATEIVLDVPDEAFAPIAIPRVVIDLPPESIRLQGFVEIVDRRSVPAKRNYYKEIYDARLEEE